MDVTSPRKDRTKILTAVVVIALLGLVFVVDAKRKAVQKELQRLTVRVEQLTGGNRAQSRETARQIVAKVRKHFAIPEDFEPTVATIVDAKSLKQKNPFYAKAENGDHLVVTTERAILYDPERDIILDVIPVQFRQAEAPKTVE